MNTHTCKNQDLKNLYENITDTKCNLCGDTFSSNSNAKRHLRLTQCLKLREKLQPANSPAAAENDAEAPEEPSVHSAEDTAESVANAVLADNDDEIVFVEKYNQSDKIRSELAEAAKMIDHVELHAVQSIPKPTVFRPIFIDAPNLAFE